MIFCQKLSARYIKNQNVDVEKAVKKGLIYLLKTNYNFWSGITLEKHSFFIYFFIMKTTIAEYLCLLFPL